MSPRRWAVGAALSLTIASACGDGNDNATPVGEPTPTPAAACGNGKVDPGEFCEPPSFCRGGCNPTTGLCVDLACNDDCTCPLPVCGDEILDPGEECDPPGSPAFAGCDLRDENGTTFALFGCTADCLCDSPCGDGFRAPHEQCDDGNVASGDGCSSTCTTEVGAASRAS